jgi:hypothetical protein
VVYPSAGFHSAVARLRLDGLVLARKVGKEDSVRRAAAKAPKERPPTSPISSTSDR